MNQSGNNASNDNRGQAMPGDRNGGGAPTSTGNKPGAVLHPETDGRLKGNEQYRPNDPDRSAQAEGGRRGGQNSHVNDGNRSNNDGNN